MRADRDVFLAANPVSRETEARLERYAGLLTEWNQGLSLVSDSTLGEIWTRHFLDSAQLLPLFPDPRASIVDMGTGAGFPGLVLAILGHREVHLVEHNIQKVKFLQAVIDALDLKVTLHAKKTESVKPFIAGAITARGLKPLNILINLGQRFLGRESVCIFPKGRRAEDELRDAQRHWRMHVERFPSITSPESTIFRLSRVAELST